MIGTIRKHSAVLWWVIVVAVIVSFVVWIGPAGTALGGRGGAGQAEYGDVDGRPVKQAAIQDAYRQAQLRERLQRSQAPMPDEARVQMAGQMVFADLKIASMGISVSDEALAAFIRERYKDPATGQSRYATLVSELAAIGAREDDMLAMERRGIGQSILADILSIPEALVTPREAEQDYRRDHEEAVASAVFFNGSNYLSKVTVTPEALGRFFTNRMSAYQIPEKFVLGYVRFPGSNHLAAAEAELAQMPDLTNRLEKAYSQRGTNDFVDDQGAPMAKPAAMARIRQEAARESSNLRAREAAVAFYNELSQKSPMAAETLDAVAKQRGLSVQITQPFARNDTPAGLEALPGVASVLDSLSAETPVSEPTVGTDGAYIMALKVRIPAATPPLEAVRARVTEDFRRQESLQAARSAGQAFHASVTNALASGKSFPESASGQGFAVVDLPAFTLSSTTVPGLPPYADLASLKNAAFALQAGQAGSFAFSRDGGFVLYLKERKQPSADAVKSGMPGYLKERRGRGARGPFVQWFTSEWEKSGLRLALEPRRDTNAMSMPQ
jgi:hypothetical protein